MKITFISFYTGFSEYGAEIFVRELSQRLALKHTVKVYSSTKKIKKTDEKLNTTNIFRRLFITPQKLKELFFYISLLPNLSRNKPDIIIPLNSGWNIPILKFFTLISKTKLIISAQSGPGWDDRFNLLWKPDLFICLTKSQLNWAQKATLFKSQKFTVIPNGVDLNKFKPQGKKIKLNLQQPIILTVAATRPPKRVGETLRAVARLKKGSFLLLGSGPLDRQINALGQKLLGPKRFLHLFVSHNQTPAYFRSADLFSLCSASSEAFGIVYVEALSSGLPIVATDDSSRREIIGKAGKFVKKPEDRIRYASVLKLALQKDWKDLPRKQGQKFSWHKISLQYEQVFLRLLNSNSKIALY